MGLIIGIIVAIATPVFAWIVLMQRSNWETGQGGDPFGGAATLVAGWCLAAGLIISHWYPIGW